MLKYCISNEERLLAFAKVLLFDFKTNLRILFAIFRNITLRAIFRNDQTRNQYRVLISGMDPAQIFSVPSSAGHIPNTCPNIMHPKYNRE